MNKYKVIPDENNYILAVSKTNTAEDNFELDLDNMELEFLCAYKIIGDRVILDEQRKAQVIVERANDDIQLRCVEYQNNLNESDYVMSKGFESLLECKSLEDLLAVFDSVKSEYAEKISNRKIWREYINKNRE